MFKCKKNIKKSAMTLVETLVAVFVLSILSTALYNIFNKTVQGVDIGQWSQQTQVKMRAATKLLKKDLGGSTYPSEIKPTDTVIKSAKSDGFWLKYKDCTGGLVDAKTFSGDILVFFINEPTKSGFGAPLDVAGKTIKIEVKVDNGKLIYKKSCATSAPDNGEMVLVENVVNAGVKVIKDAASDAVKILHIEIHCAHPKYIKNTIKEVVEVPLPTEQMEVETL